MRNLKLMTDYHCFPLWDMDEPTNVDPAALPLSEELRTELDRWAEAYDALLNDDDPASSGFASDDARLAFDQVGLGLWVKLSSELGPAYRVWYRSVARRALLAPEALPVAYRHAVP